VAPAARRCLQPGDRQRRRRRQEHRRRCAAGSIIGAQFVQRFVNKVPWAHLDIAGVAWSKKDTPTVPKGATAFGVRLLDRFVRDYYEKG
jgi:leucyl aminopeptidase